MTVFRVFSLWTSLYLLLFVVDVNTFQLSSKWFSDQMNSELLEEEESEEKSRLENEEYILAASSIDAGFILIESKRFSNRFNHHVDFESDGFKNLLLQPPKELV